MPPTLGEAQVCAKKMLLSLYVYIICIWYNMLILLLQIRACPSSSPLDWRNNWIPSETEGIIESFFLTKTFVSFQFSVYDSDKTRGKSNCFLLFHEGLLYPCQGSVQEPRKKRINPAKIKQKVSVLWRFSGFCWKSNQTFFSSQTLLMICLLFGQEIELFLDLV